MIYSRRKTSQIQVGKVGIGSNFPISVQSMTTTKTRDVEGTLAQIYEIASNGADIVRVLAMKLKQLKVLLRLRKEAQFRLLLTYIFSIS